MKKFSLLLFLVLFFIGCNDNKTDTTFKKIHWDRDMCEYCKMVVSVRNYAVEVINPTNGKHYLFDDIGCTILWFKDEQISWENNAVIYIADTKTQKFIDARKAYYTLGKITPMDYGFSAYESKDEIKAKEFFNFEQVRMKILRGETLQNPQIKKAYNNG